MAKYSAGFPDYIPGTWKHMQIASPKWPISQADACLAPLHSLMHVPILSTARYSRDICTCKSDPSRQMETHLMFWWSFCDRFCRALAQGVCVWELCFLLCSSLACWSETLHHFWSAPTGALGRFLPSSFSSLISISNGDPRGSVCHRAAALQQCPRSALPPKCCSSCSAWAMVNYFLPNSASNR